MAKRFTDTDKWKREWFRKLTPTAKLVWLYIFDNVNHAGVLITDFGLMSFQIGLDVSEQLFLEIVGERAIKFDSDKFLIPAYLKFQYGSAKDSFGAKKAALEYLRKMGLLDHAIGILPPIEFKEISKGDTPPTVPPESGDSLIKIKSYINIKSNSSRKESLRENQAQSSTQAFENRFRFNLQALLEKYPLNQKFGKSLTRLAQIIDTEDKYRDVDKAIELYRAHCERMPPDFKVMTLPSFLDEWEDWLNPNNGKLNIKPKDQGRMKILTE